MYCSTMFGMWQMVHCVLIALFNVLFNHGRHVVDGSLCSYCTVQCAVHLWSACTMWCTVFLLHCSMCCSTMVGMWWMVHCVLIALFSVLFNCGQHVACGALCSYCTVQCAVQPWSACTRCSMYQMVCSVLVALFSVLFNCCWHVPDGALCSYCTVQYTVQLWSACGRWCTVFLLHCSIYCSTLVGVRQMVHCVQIVLFNVLFNHGR